MKNYTAQDIEVAEGLEGVRKNPAMYLGSLGSRGSFQAAKEIFDNAMDECKQRKNGKITIIIDHDIITVADNGRGIPVDLHPKTKKSGVETVFTLLHAGAKSGAKAAYSKNTIGVHGVGAAVTNALSSRCLVQTWRNGAWHEIAFAKGKTVASLRQAKRSLIPHEKAGTIVQYQRDHGILPDQIEIKDIISYCDLNRFFAPVTLTLKIGSKVKEFKPLNPSILVQRLLKKQDLATLTKPFVIITPHVRLVGVWTNSTEINIQSHVSGSPTSGGTHAAALKEVLAKSFLQICKRELAGCKVNLNPLAGLVAVFDFQMDQPSFEGQAKTVLASSSAKTMVRNEVSKPLLAWLKKHKPDLTLVIEHVIAVSKIASQLDHSKKLARDAKKGGLSAFPKNATVALQVPAAKRELFVIEGESAGGTIKKAKFAWQESLPLRGKIPNVVKLDTKTKTNESLLNIIRMTGYDPNNPSKPLRVGKIILLTDADPDGLHIQVLLLTALYKIMPQVFARNLVYLVKAPLFEALSQGQQVYGNSLAELNAKYTNLTNIHRMKGWGSCEPPMLRSIALDPANRQLLLVKPIKKQDTLKFELLMGSDTSARRQMLGI